MGREMVPLDSAWVIAYLVVMVAALSKGVTGFAFNLVSTPILLLVLEPRAVIAVNLVLASLLSVFVVVQSPRQVNIRRVLSLTAASALGVPLGIYLLLLMSAPTLKLVMGLVVVLSAIPMFLGYSRSFRREGLASGLFGFVSGVLGSSTSLSGPPIVLFLVNQGWDKESFRASISAYFFLTNMVALASLTASGAINLDMISAALALIPACLIGFYLGVKLLPRVNASIFNRMSVIIVMATGVFATFLEVIKLYR